MPEIKNQELVEKLVKIAKRNLKPAKKPEENLTNINWRFELTQKNLRSLVSILVLSAVFSGVYWWNSRVSVNDQTALSIPAVISVEKVEQQNVAISEIVIYVSGDVVNSGVYKLTSGSRVIDALEKAGGLAQSGKIGDNNLARILTDGEQIDFSKNTPSKIKKNLNTVKKTSGCINLNSATLSELDSLPGVGPVLAQRIIEWKESNGGFKSVEQLGEVDGIGKSKFSTISAKTCV